MKQSSKLFKFIGLLLVVGLLFAALPTGQVKAATITVCASGGCTHTTIQAAINAAAAGDTINVAAGTYPENVLIDKSLVILGPNSDISPVTGIRQAEAVVTSFTTLYNVRLSGVTIKGFTVSGQIAPEVAGIYIGTTDNATIEHNLITNTTNHGIVHFDSAIQNFSVLDNKIVSVGTGYTGIYVGFLTNAVISDNVIDTPSYAGVNITAGSTGVDIMRNQISNTAGVGIQVASGNGDVEVSSNIINNAGNGLNEADKGGIRLYGSGFTGLVTVSHNSISGSQNGIGIRNTPPCDLSKLLIEHNSIAANNEAQVYNGCQNASILNASQNWWGSARGPAAGSIIGLTNYTPWCTNVSCTEMSNMAPEAVDDAYATAHDKTLTIAATPSGVLANDTDLDGDVKTATLVTNVSRGTLSLYGDGSFTYTPAPGFVGTDTFVYLLVTHPALAAAVGWTDEALVTITVTPYIYYFPLIVK